MNRKPLYLLMMELRDEIRRVLLESIELMDEWVVPQNIFPYGPVVISEPQQIDPLTDYVLDWNKFSSNNSVFDFPRDEFEIGLAMERNKDPKSQLLDLATKVINTLKSDPHFYSSIKNSRANG